MGLFACRACAAKDATIASLERQLESAHAREEKQAETIAALADAHAHARLYPKPKQEGEERPARTKLPSPYEAMAYVPELPVGMTQAALERKFTEGMGSNKGVVEFVNPDGSKKPQQAS